MELEDLAKSAQLLSVGDANYPTSLLDLSDAPALLRVAGRWPLLGKRVAIVGTRRATEDATEFTYHFAMDFARMGCVVVSGGALGIDSAAHRGALDGGGSTIVVLPTGIGDAYPQVNRPLFRHAAAVGALLTEVEDGTTPHRGRFLTRNRLIAALADVVVVVQAPIKSGALSTAHHALRLQRKLFVVPTAPWDSRGRGGLGLLQKGATICVRAKDVLLKAPSSEKSRPPQRSQKQKEASDIECLELIDRQVYEALGKKARHPDDLCRTTGILVFELQPSILRLQLLGWVEARPGGRYRRCETIA